MLLRSIPVRINMLKKNEPDIQNDLVLIIVIRQVLLTIQHVQRVYATNRFCYLTMYSTITGTALTQ